MPKTPQWVKNALDIVEMDEQQREDEHGPLSRLAAGDVVSMKSREGGLAGGISEAAERWGRVRSTYRPSERPSNFMLMLEARRMGEFLAESRVTINFNASSYFQDGIPDAYSNIWQRETGKPSHHKGNREIVEPELGRYGSARPEGYPYAELEDDDELDDRYTTETVRDRMDTYLSANSALFAPASRPRYGALDFQECRHGGAVTMPYGSSFLVLREHVKHRATFTPRDSFGYLSNRRRAAEESVSFTHIDELLLTVWPETLYNLFEYAHEVKRPGTAFSAGIHYIEAQLYTDLTLSRDVSEIHVAMENDLSLWSPKQKDKLRSRLRRFGRENFVSIHYI